MARETITLTYAGRRQDRNGKLQHLYFDGPEANANQRVFKKQLYPASAGAHLTFEAEREGDNLQVYGATGQFAGRVDDVEQATRWAAEDRAAIGASEAAKMAKAVDPFKDALRPLKDTYMNGTPVQRAALVTAIIREVTSWS
jgi:hypothetical protein